MNDNESPNGATLNIAILDDLRRLDRSPGKSIVGELLESFLTEAPSTLCLIRNLYNEKKVADVRMQAHSLKSNAGNLGADRFSAICQRIETGAEESMGRWLDELDAEYRLLEGLMRQQLKKLLSG